MAKKAHKHRRKQISEYHKRRHWERVEFGKVVAEEFNLNPLPNLDPVPNLQKE
jgi:hypothetical protein